MSLLIAASPTFAASSVVYNAIPTTLPPNMASLGFQATQTSEFGDSVHLGGTNRILSTVNVTMSDWALYSEYSTTSPYSNSNVSWTHPVTVNIYSNHLGSNGVPDTLLATKSQVITIPWRPEANSTCVGGTAWRADDGQCYNGIAFNASFDLSNLNVTLPNDVIVGVAYNTQSYGTNPLGQAGPYNSLNVGVNGSTTVGADADINSVFWNTATAGWYADGGAAGVGIFRQDTNWAPYGTTPIQISAKASMPTDKGQCKKDGWKSFDAFKNQGDCVSFVATMGTNLPSY